MICLEEEEEEEEGKGNGWGGRVFGRQWEGGRRLVDCAFGLCSPAPLLSFFSFILAFALLCFDYLGCPVDAQSMNRVGNVSGIYNTFFLKKISLN